jgi:hypothetical protein
LEIVKRKEQIKVGRLCLSSHRVSKMSLSAFGVGRDMQGKRIILAFFSSSHHQISLLLSAKALGWDL